MKKDYIEEIKQHFLKDVKNHSIEILKDDGKYRHLKFSNNGSNVYRFDLITWDGYLCICGDMGENVFYRKSDDMFNFFNGGDDLSINLEYWSEKCTAGEIKKFDQNSFQESIDEWFEDYKEQNHFQETEDSLIYIEDMKIYLEDVKSSYDIYEAVQNIRDFIDNYNLENDFVLDFVVFEEYTYHYVWKLFAIVWGIQYYINR